jgi:hypothetical protein
LISYHFTAFNHIQEEISGWREDLFTTWYSSVNVFERFLLISNIVYVVIWFLQGPPLGTSSSGSSASSKRQKGEKNKRYGQHRFMGELFALPFLSKFPIPSDANASQTRILNE